MRVSTDATERRKPYDSESLLEVAVGVFNTRGYDGTSMEHLAQAAGITKSSIYHHVAGKEDLLRRALDRASSVLFAALDSDTGGDTGGDAPAIERLEAVVRRTTLALMDNLTYVTLFLRVRGNSETERSAMQARREFDRRVTAIVAEAAAAGDLRPDADPALVTRLLFGTVNSLIEWYRPDGPDSADDITEAMVDLTLHGLRRT